MEYNFKRLYKEMFFEHYKLSLVMMAVVLAFISLVLTVHGYNYGFSLFVSLLVVIGFVVFKLISSAVRASMLIYFCKKGHHHSQVIYREWVRY